VSAVQSEWFLIPLGFLVGAYGTLIGAGGGFVLVPALLFLYPKASPSTVTGISLAVVFFNAASGSIAYARYRRIDYRTGLIFGTATIPGAVLGAIVVTHIPRGPFDALFGMVLILLAFVSFRGPLSATRGLPFLRRRMVRRTIVDRSGVRYEYEFSPSQGIVLSVGVGFVSSLLGIGGGIIHVPAMVLLLNFPAHIATATSHFVLAIMALTGTSVHLIGGEGGELAPGAGLIRALIVAIGVIPGAQVGAALSRHIHGTLIVRLLAVALAALGLRLLLNLFL
jgi:uncharacterized membrane protein YfcA